MRFFFPSVTNLSQAETAYRAIRDRLASANGGISDRRIYRLKFQQDGNQRTAVVGSDAHGFGNEPIVAIFERSDGGFYVCTQKAAGVEAEPHAVQTSSVIEAEEFSALA